MMGRKFASFVKTSQPRAFFPFSFFFLPKPDFSFLLFARTMKTKKKR